LNFANSREIGPREPSGIRESVKKLGRHHGDELEFGLDLILDGLQRYLVS
jgi:hypothetical protein